MVVILVELILQLDSSFFWKKNPKILAASFQDLKNKIKIKKLADLKIKKNNKKKVIVMEIITPISKN